MPHFKSELDFQRAICLKAMENDWLVYCHPDSRKSAGYSTPGFPDIVLAKSGRLAFWECKLNDPPKPSEAQRSWLSILPTKTRNRYTEIETRLVTPTNWTYIQHFLTE